MRDLVIMWSAFHSHIDSPVFIVSGSFGFEMAASRLQVCFCVTLIYLAIMEIEVIRFLFKYLLVLLFIGIDDGWILEGLDVWLFHCSLPHKSTPFYVLSNTMYFVSV